MSKQKKQMSMLSRWNIPSLMRLVHLFPKVEIHMYVQIHGNIHLREGNVNIETYNDSQEPLKLKP